MSSNKCKKSGCNAECYTTHEYCLDHWKEQDNYSYGLDADVQLKISSKFDAKKEAQVKAWLEELVGQKCSGSLHEWLKSGVVLCTAINKIKPNTVRQINMQKMAFKQMENITFYLEGCKALGLKATDVFVTKDLYENYNMVSVIDNILALGGAAQKVSGFKGPYIGIKYSEEQKREFTKEQLTAYVPSRQTVGDFGYQDESKAPTLSRQIIKNVSGVKASEVSSRQNTGSYGIVKETNSTGMDKIIKNPTVFEANRGKNAITTSSTTTSTETANTTATTTTSSSTVVSSSGTISGAQFCTQCGVKSDGTAKFCGSCGGKL
eukprot:TRINITY_DN1532_c0_g1_i1.p1 TRINITY_DN1532_c0_g1~~TRINITY_DN1532_c0_g1_i1.p1  ORF type:complete len:320 (-),score=67.39 TRINITY_DN1532_c0_g1_i1:273-1232(-)